MNFSGLNRKHFIQQLQQEELDLLIIGGGITGAGIALDSCLRGLRVGLVEMQDFSAGTSSRSTKLIHGGLRYLKQLDFKLVAEVGRERAIVYENAPHVTSSEKMLLPFYKSGTFGRYSTSIGLKLYDYLAGVKKTERRYMLDREETIKLEPYLMTDGLIGSGIYMEYKTDDSRLTIEIIKKAVEHGTIAVNYLKAEEFIYRADKVIGVKVTDATDNQSFNIFAKVIINATGPWVDTLREMDNSKKDKALLLTKGVHLVFDKSRFIINDAIYFENSDRRMIFAIPRADKTYLGTTDTYYQDDLKNPRVTLEDSEYLLDAANKMFPLFNLKKEDIISSWAGLRVLIHEAGKSPSEISRRDEVFISDSGLISIAGGKLTGYRKMAEKVVDIVSKRLYREEGYPFIKSVTKKTTLSGGEVGGAEGFLLFRKEKIREGIDLGISYEDAVYLINKYGANVVKVYQLIKNYKPCGLPKTVYASLLYGLEAEMVIYPQDYFIRRTGELLFNPVYVAEWKNSAIELMSEYYEWTEEERDYFANDLENEIIHVTKLN